MPRRRRARHYVRCAPSFELADELGVSESPAGKGLAKVTSRNCGNLVRKQSKRAEKDRLS